jgi:hypothetical protein
VEGRPFCQGHIIYGLVNINVIDWYHLGGGESLSILDRANSTRHTKLWGKLTLFREIPNFVL